MTESEDIILRDGKPALRGFGSPQMIKVAPEEPLLCAVCGCTWIEGQKPEEACPEATCPCHNRYWDSTDELVKRYLWGDR